MQKPTEKQLKILEFVRNWQQQHGYSPSLREIASHFAINVSSVSQHLHALKRKGCLYQEAGRKRSLQLMSGSRGSTSLRRNVAPLHLVAHIAAGVPIETQDDADDLLYVTPEWFGRGHIVAVKVQGNSMTGDGIWDGDIAVIKLQGQAHPSEIVAVRVGGTEVTLKRVQPLGQTVALIPSNPDFHTQHVPADQVEILGTYEGVIRRRRAP